jgi:ABC-type Zn uptake system ZnuABC Zn-binding protein ZnuA
VSGCSGSSLWHVNLHKEFGYLEKRYSAKQTDIVVVIMYFHG